MAAKATGMTVAEALAEHEQAEPTPLSSNEDAWAALLHVRQCRHNVMGHPWVPCWVDVKTVLDLHDLWTAEVQRKLGLCFNELLTLESEQRELNGKSLT